MFIKKLCFLAIITCCLIATSCSDNLDEQNKDSNSNPASSVENILKYAKEEYPVKFSEICTYNKLFSNPAWSNYNLLKNTQDTVLISIPLSNELEDENWQLIVNGLGDEYEMFVVRIPEGRMDSLPLNEQRRLVVTNSGGSQLYKQIIRNGNRISIGRFKPTPQLKNWAYWNCPEPEKYGNCIDGGALPEVIVYPGYTPSDSYWWWWLNDINGITPPSGGSTGGSSGSGNDGGQTRPEYGKAANMSKDADVQKAMKTMTQNMKNDASKDKGRRERGFWVYYDEKTKKYYTGNEKTGEYVKGGKGTNGSVSPGGSSPSRNGSHIPSTAKPVSFVHTHTPLTYENNCQRKVGFSQSDIDYADRNNIDIIVIDYIGTQDDNGQYYIYGGHNVNDPTKEYHYSPSK